MTLLVCCPVCSTAIAASPCNSFQVLLSSYSSLMFGPLFSPKFRDLSFFSFLLTSFGRKIKKSKRMASMAAAMGAVLLLLVTVTAVSLPSTLGTNGLHFVFGKIAAKLCCKLKRGSIKRLELFAARISVHRVQTRSHPVHVDKYSTFSIILV